MLSRTVYGHFADHRVRGVVDVAHVVFHGLAHEDVYGSGVQAVVLLEESNQLGGGVLRCLVQRAGVAHGHHVGFVDCPGPLDGLALEEAQREGDIEGDFDPGADDFAVALHGVAVADMEQPAFDENGEVNGYALDEFPVVHVAAVGVGRGGGNGLASRRRHAEAAHHRFQRDPEPADGKVFEADGGGGVVFEVDFPLEAVPVVVEFGRVPEIQHVGGDYARRVPDPAVGRQFVEGDGQRVARFRALEVEGARLGIAGWSDRLARGVTSARVHGGCCDGIAAGDVQHRVVRANGGVVGFRDEVMVSHGNSSKESATGLAGRSA